MTFNYFLVYLLTLLTYAGLDLLWVGIIAHPFYKKQIGSLMSPDVNWLAVILFYLLFVFGILFFCVFPALSKDSLKHAMMYGALFGLMAYGTYDLVNWATLKNWSGLMVVIDILWGTLIVSIVATTGFYIAKWLI